MCSCLTPACYGSLVNAAATNTAQRQHNQKLPPTKRSLRYCYLYMFLQSTPLCVRVYVLAPLASHASRCDPNCHSLRLGGNLAVFCRRDIRKGEEIFHNYTPLTALLGCAASRAEQLFFACACERCGSETEEMATRLRLLDFPVGHFQSDGGKVGLSAALRMSYLFPGQVFTFQRMGFIWICK